MLFCLSAVLWELCSGLDPTRGQLEQKLQPNTSDQGQLTELRAAGSQGLLLQLSFPGSFIRSSSSKGSHQSSDNPQSSPNIEKQSPETAAPAAASAVLWTHLKSGNVCIRDIPIPLLELSYYLRGSLHGRPDDKGNQVKLAKLEGC